MRKVKIIFAAVAIAALALMMTACGGNSSDSDKSDSKEADVSNPKNVSELKLDNSKWQYDKDNDVYYQIGISYCTDPAEKKYEKLSVYIPGKYMTAKKNSDGTYTCEVSDKKKVSGYTAKTAPVVIPINTAGYSAQAAQTEYNYEQASDYLKAGYVYIYAGCRGREHGGSPLGVTDLKAAVRYLRYNKDSLAGDLDRIFSFGHSGGGAQSSILGASGDSELYYKYLEKIGAVMKDDEGNVISDAISGAMCWCPITALDQADEAYEWMMGQFSSSGTRADGTFTAALSDDLAEAYAEYINKAGFKSGDETLTLEKTKSGTYLSGSYYDYLMDTIETSLNNFLKDTKFPYTSGSNEMSGMPGAGGEAPSSNGGEAPNGNGGEAPNDSSEGAPSSNGGEAPNGSSQESVTYNSAAEYIKALNEDGEWIEYDKKTNTAKIKSLSAFVKHCKTASKDVGAFDALDRSQAENKVFGDSGNGLHFDKVMAKLLEKNADKYSKLSGYKSSYAKDYSGDIRKKDSLGVSSQERQNMYNPMYYISDYYKGAGSSKVAKYWRISTGIEQGDTSLTTEMNLALALENNDDVKDVIFQTVWGQGHTEAERSGSAGENFVKWVDKCCK